MESLVGKGENTMSNKPIIGIIGKYQGRVGKDLWHKVDVADEFRYLVVENDGIAISILPTGKKLDYINDENELSKEELNDLYRQLEFCDGFILQGGLYSCKYEVEIAKKVLELDKPLIGICAGFNDILRALGTDVILDKTKSHDHYDINYRHPITLVEDSKLYNLIGKKELQVNSIHSRISPKEMVEPYAKATSFSEDGLVESFEIPNKKFVLGIKWHLELMMEEEYVHRIFKEFVEACKK